MKLIKIFKSKTINFNTLIPAVAVMVKALGYEVPAEVWTVVLAIGNFVLRFVTKEPMSKKIDG